MKSSYKKLLLGFVSTFLFLLLPGCYTQLRTEREERRDEQREYKRDYEQDHSYAQESDTPMYSNDSPTIINNYYYNDDYSYRSRCQIGFTYYYPAAYWPSYTFAVAYNNPWSYGSYDSWWCGTSYVSYPACYYPYYPTYYFPGSYGYNVGYTTPYVNHGSRGFGSSRGRTTREATNASGGYVNDSRQSTNTFPTELSTGRARNSNPTSAGSGRRDGSSVQRTYGSRSPRNNDTRDTRPQQKVREENSSAPTLSMPQVWGNRNTGSVRVSAPSYSPKPSAPPPASRGGSAPSGGGSRGGNTRSGGRR